MNCSISLFMVVNNNCHFYFDYVRIKINLVNTRMCMQCFLCSFRIRIRVMCMQCFFMLIQLMYAGCQGLVVTMVIKTLMMRLTKL